MTLKWRHLMCWCDWMFIKNPVTLWLTLSTISATLHYRVHVFCATPFNSKVYYHPSITLLQLEFIFTRSRSIREILTLKTLGSEIKHRFFCAKSSLSQNHQQSSCILPLAAFIMHELHRWMISIVLKPSDFWEAFALVLKSSDLPPDFSLHSRSRPDSFCALCSHDYKLLAS